MRGVDLSVPAELAANNTIAVRDFLAAKEGKA